jgi:hypothetical protein
MGRRKKYQPERVVNPLRQIKRLVKPEDDTIGLARGAGDADK